MNSLCFHTSFFFILFTTNFPSSGFSNTEKAAIDELTPMAVTAKGGRAFEYNSLVYYQFETDTIDRAARSPPEVLSGIPSIMVQKTAPGQSSPYIRGLTGYHNDCLSTAFVESFVMFRAEPILSTVEIFGSDREAPRGTKGVLFGADAVGASLIRSPKNLLFNQRNNRLFKVLGRVSSAEHSFSAGFSAEVSSPKWFSEISHMERSFGDLDGGKKVKRQKIPATCNRF